MRAPTTSMMDELERSIHDALCATLAARQDGCVVPGGGAVQLACASQLRQEAAGLARPSDAIGFEVMAQALEVLPLTIASNGGLDGPRVLAQAKQRHCQAGGECVGIDLDLGGVRDMAGEAPIVLEPSRLTKSMVAAAVRLTAQVLRIDENIMMVPRSSFKVPT